MNFSSQVVKKIGLAEARSCWADGQEGCADRRYYSWTDRKIKIKEMIMGHWPYNGDEDWPSPFEEFIERAAIFVLAIFLIAAFCGKILSVLGLL